MGIGSISLDAAGSVTAPTSFPLTLPTANTASSNEDYPFTFARFPREKSLVLFNGYAHLRHIKSGTLPTTMTLYGLGGLAPQSAPAVASTGSGARATATLTTTGTFTSGEYAVLVSGADITNKEWRVYFVSAFGNTGAFDKYTQVLIGASAAASLDNLKSAINGTSGEGSTYRLPSVEKGIDTPEHPAKWSDWITAETNTDTTQVFQAVAYGEQGNAFESTETCANASFAAATFASGVAGTGKGIGKGARAWGYAYRRTIDGMMTGMSPEFEYEQLGDGAAAISAIADSPAEAAGIDTLDVKTWLRTRAGGGVFHEGYDIDNADTSDDDDLTDELIDENTEQDPFRRIYPEGYPPRYALVSERDGRLFGARHLAAKTYTTGTAAVTFKTTSTPPAASWYATLSAAAHPRRTMEGRSFVVTTSTVTLAVVYRIVYVDEVNKRVYLDRPYEAGDNGTAAYAIIDDRNPFAVGFSEPSDYHNWPADNEIEGIHSDNAEGVTAIVSGTVFFTRTGIWTLRGDTPDTYSFVHEYEGVGCVGGQAWCVADGRIWFLGDDGIYTWAPNTGEPQKVSSPPVGPGGPTGVGGTVTRINRTYIHLAVAHYEPRRRIVRFFVPLDADTTNRYALVYDLQTRLWALDQYGVDVTYAVTIPDPAGGAHMIVGDVQGDVWEFDVGTSDGAYGFEAKNAITSSTRLTVTCSGASFPTTGDGLKGVSVTFIDASGNVSYNTISSNTGTVLTLARIESTAPTGTAYVGAIHAIVETGRFAYGDPARNKVLAYARVAFSPQDDGQFFFSHTFNQGDATVGSDADGDFTLTDGEEQFWIRNRGTLLRWRLDVFEVGCEPAFLGVFLDVPRMQALAEVL